MNGFRGFASAISLITMVMFGAEPPASRLPHAWLGFGFVIQNFDAKSPVRQWLLIQKIAPGGPAMEAGLHVQDAVISINGVPVSFKDAKAALSFFRAVNPDSRLRLGIIRQERRMVVTLRARPLPQTYAPNWLQNDLHAAQEDAAKSPREKPIAKPAN